MQDMGLRNLQGDFAYTGDIPTEPFLIPFIVAMTTENPRPYPSDGMFFSTSGSKFKVNLTLIFSYPLISSFCHLCEREGNV